MPDWFIQAVATGGPAAAIIMSYMWWRAEKRAEKYETLWLDANKVLPEKIINFTEQHRATHEKLVKAIWANIRELDGGRRATRRMTDGSSSSIPPGEAEA